MAIQEKPLPKAKKRVKNTPLSEIEEDVLDIIRAGKKAAAARAKSVPRLPAEKKKKPEEFFIGDLDLAPKKNIRVR